MFSGFQNYISLCSCFLPCELLSSLIAYAKNIYASQVEITWSEKKQNVGLSLKWVSEIMDESITINPNGKN